VTGESPRTALDAVHSARPIVARLTMTADKEDLAADIIDSWTAVETGLRVLIGGSSLTGQALIRELRQRHFLSLDQANALAEFHAARERAGRTDYAPTEGDVNATRDAFLKLEAGLMGDPSARVSTPVTSRPSVADAVVMPAIDPSTGRSFIDADVVPEDRARPSWFAPLLGILGLAVVAGIAWYALAGRSSGGGAYAQGVAAYVAGKREVAQGSFRKAAVDAPTDPMPHVYLARMERESGNLSNANTEAVEAVKLGPTSAAALRELASTLFAQKNYDGARTFYARAAAADPTDKLSQGFLGCSLVRLGRVTEGVKFIERAGPGAWSACAPTSGTIPAAIPPR
jgi:tetratricopeptide (TPR) repeat protein